MIEAFMWGYWGWGGSTKHLIDAFDEAEDRRGFAPPVFVDIRIRRAVRAVGFRGDAFEKLLGAKRHRWMQGLGNKSVLTGADEMELSDPSQVDALLDLIVERHRDNRRVLFFCACQSPRFCGERSCHRDLVAERLVRAAKRRGVPLSVTEWPGGDPERIDVELPRSMAKAFLGDGLTVPMPSTFSVARGVALPWGSYGTVSTPDGDVVVALGPAIRSQDRWALRLPVNVDGEAVSERALLSLVRRVRKESGWEPRVSMSGVKGVRTR